MIPECKNISGGTHMSSKPRLGELLVQQNLVSQKTIDIALRVQIGGDRRLGHILVRMKEITDDQLVETLEQQLKTPIISIDEKFSPEVKNIIPRYLCKHYGVLPLALEEKNILQLAMSDPSDENAISDLQHYTEKAIKPLLARQTEIDKEIIHRIPFSIKDFFTPQTNIWATRAMATMTLVLVIGLGWLTYDYYYTNQYGTVSTTNTHVLYKNHDLILGVDKTGTISLLGHGAFAKGLYSVSFNDPETLNMFIKSKNKDFSEKQRKWLKWAIKQTHTSNRTGNLVANAN
jgi:hypothetical protein